MRSSPHKFDLSSIGLCMGSLPFVPLEAFSTLILLSA